MHLYHFQPTSFRQQMKLKSSFLYFFQFSFFFYDFLLFHLFLLIPHLFYYSLSFKHKFLSIMLNILLLICQTLYNFLTSEYICTFVSLILLFHFILFNFIQNLHIVLSNGILYIFICFLFLFFQELYSGLQLSHVDFLLLPYLTSLHDRVKILRLLAHLPQRKITLFVQIYALFADAPDFDGG